MKLSSLSLKTKIIVVLVLVAVIGLGWYTTAIRSDNRVTKALKEMPTGRVQVVNDAGNTLTFNVKIAETVDHRKEGFNGVGEAVVQDTILYYIYTREVTERHSVNKVRVPLEIGYFQADGTLIGISKTRAGATITYGPPTRTQYQYAIMVPDGFFARNQMSIAGGTTLLPDTLRRQ